ncbi:MAG: hypothetical protein FWE68_05185, partial [Defluviitaleaceae bacterium]|nr:hypothetical protein [Defluviitaleaceae bacterium]
MGILDILFGGKKNESGGGAPASAAKYQDPAVKVTSGDAALKLLKDGNARFIANKLVPPNHKEALGKTGTQQSPFASVLTCADSR